MSENNAISVLGVIMGLVGKAGIKKIIINVINATKKKLSVEFLWSC